MLDSSDKYQSMRVWLRYALIGLICWIAFVFLPSVPVVRSFLALPLIVTDENAHGDAAYILAGGNAFKERLAAGADLYHIKRVAQIIISRDSSKSSFNFRDKRNWTPTEWAVDYLQWLGVPAEKITIMDLREHGFFGTLNEAKALAKLLPEQMKQLVIITSAPHTRRACLTFKKRLSPHVKIAPYAASSFDASMEMWEPLWIEYLKLLVYYLYT